ncbi:MAG: class I SAM-dependent methyltransferase [Anaerolineales bacterium]|nr:class I SAM-dependent methyltransferase [Anaerolineales bacterium]
MIYDDFSADYDRFVNWPGRLAAEIPFLESQLKQAGVQRVLDTACGTGMHAIALAELGFEVAGADVSRGMVERARANAETSGMKIQFEAAGFGEMKAAFGSQAFEAVLCLGNSLPHLLTPEALSAALHDFADCLKPGGLLIIQNRNFDAVMQKRERWMEPQSAQEGQTEWLFLRFYDYDADGLIPFHVVTLRREAGKAWTQLDMATRLRPILHDEMKSSLETAGFASVSCYGDLTGAPFDTQTSGNLVVMARLTGKIN